MNFIETNNQTEIISDIIEQKIVKILLNNTKLRQLLLNNQLTSNKELEDISIIGTIILLYTLAMIVTYYFILLYNNLFSDNKSSIQKGTRSKTCAKRRKTLKKSTKDSIDSIIQDFKDNSEKLDVGNSLSDSVIERKVSSTKTLTGTKKRKTIAQGARIRTP